MDPDDDQTLQLDYDQAALVYSVLLYYTHLIEGGSVGREILTGAPLDKVAALRDAVSEYLGYPQQGEVYWDPDAELERRVSDFREEELG